jgi:hypothetical protein
MDATPAEVRDALAAASAEDAELFDAEWSHALDSARTKLDLTELDDVLHRWRVFAWSAQDNPSRHRRMMDQLARVEAGETPPAGIPWDDATAGLARHTGHSA